MADKKISALTAGSALGGTEKIPMVQSSSTVYTTPADIATYLSSILQTKIKYAKLSHSVGSGTSSGTFTSGAWRTRTLNTEDHDADSIVTLSSNQFTLAAGTYRVMSFAMAYLVEGHTLKIRNITDSTDPIIGLPGFHSSSVSSSIPAIAAGELVIAGTKTFELQHYCDLTRSTDGFGKANTHGVNEVYAQVEIWKVA